MYYKLKDGIFIRNIGGIYFIIDIFEPDYGKNKEILVINETGANIVEKMIEGKNFCLKDIVQEVKKIYYDIPENILDKDITQLICRLIEESYVEELNK